MTARNEHRACWVLVAQHPAGQCGWRSGWRMACLVLLLICAASPAGAQNNGGGNNNQNNGAAGIRINANGLVEAAFGADPALQLKAAQQTAWAARALPENVQQASSGRKVSLVRLEARCRELSESQAPWPVDVRYLAGLTRIDAVYIYPDQRDVVIVGPAGAFAPDAVGRMLSVETRRPVLRLDQGVELLRVAWQGLPIGCSIDPVPERLAALNRFLQTNSTPAGQGAVEQRYRQMASILGLQNVSVNGVAADSPAAQVLVEADLRMKLLSMGLVPSQVKGLRSHLSMLVPGGNSLQRWWFVPIPTTLARSEDSLAWQLSGPRVELRGQEELTNSQGERADSESTRATTSKYAAQFTAKYAELSEKSIVFAELQNLVDWAIVGAVLGVGGGAQQARWSGELFFDDTWKTYEPRPVPKQVSTVTSYRRAGKVMLGLVGGGVTVDVAPLLRRGGVVVEDPAPLHAGRVSATPALSAVSPVPADSAAESPPVSTEQTVWWWD